jgi:hypothetical protein
MCYLSWEEEEIQAGLHGEETYGCGSRELVVLCIESLQKTSSYCQSTCLALLASIEDAFFGSSDEEVAIFMWNPSAHAGTLRCSTQFGITI